MTCATASSFSLKYDPPVVSRDLNIEPHLHAGRRSVFILDFNLKPCIPILEGLGKRSGVETRLPQHNKQFILMSDSPSFCHPTPPKKSTIEGIVALLLSGSQLHLSYIDITFVRGSSDNPSVPQWDDSAMDVCRQEWVGFCCSEAKRRQGVISKSIASNSCDSAGNLTFT